MALREDLLPLVEDLRGIRGELGFAIFEVYVRVRKWTGARPGMGTVTETRTRLLVNGENPKVVAKNTQDRVAGNSAYQSGMWDVGPLTPGFVTEEMISPQNDGQATVMDYILKGPGLPDDGLVCQKIADRQDRALRIMLTLRAAGTKGV